MKAMTLATHIVIATAVAGPLAKIDPTLGFLAALASHYLSDAIPHWDYPLKSVDYDKDSDQKTWSHNPRSLLLDLSRMAADGSIGATISFFMLWPTTFYDFLSLFLIILGSTLPDFLQGLYFIKHTRFLNPLQRFHDSVHTKIKLGHYPLIGVPLQLIILLAALFLTI